MRRCNLEDCAELGSLLDLYKAQLAMWVKTDSHRGKREQRGVEAMFETLRSLGYPGSRRPVDEFAKRWRAEQGNATRRAASVPLSFELGGIPVRLEL